MNTPERNDKNVQKMQEFGKIYSESDEDKDREKEEAQKNALENATREFPLEGARRIVTIVCGGLWAFSVIGILFGVDFRAMLPFLFFSLSLLAFLNLPAFFAKKKKLDFIICIIAGIACLLFGLSLLTVGN